MADYDLVVRGGTVHEGTGAEPRDADVAIVGGRIAAVGVITGSGAEEIDARGAIVTPGFIDVHSHYDGQAMWAERMAPSSNHGVTSVLMGNCGVGFAPCRPDQRDMLVKLMEGVEEIPEVVMATGLPWNWETFPEYLDALAERRFDIDVGAQVPHSALRVYAMGERGARREAATEEDLDLIRTLTREAVEAGAIGVSTSRHLLHRTKAGQKAYSLYSDEPEYMALAQGLRDAGSGVFQMITNNLNDAGDEFALMRRLARESGRPLSFTLMQIPEAPKGWTDNLRLLHEAAAEGLEIRGQVYPRPGGVLMGLDLSIHPFMLHPSFRPLVDLPLAEKVAALRDPDLRARLLAEEPWDPNPNLRWLVSTFPNASVLGDPPNYEPTLADRIGARAAAGGLTPHELVYNLLLEDEGQAVLLSPVTNYIEGNLDAARLMESHPHTVLALGDGGAHYGSVCDASYPTSYLPQWVRDAAPGKGVALPRAVRALTLEPAQSIGLNDRGRIAAGYKADLNVIDFERLRLHPPRVVRDLPAGGRRLRQAADGYVATIVSGQATYREGEATGALPGRLIRGQKAGPGG